MNKVYLFDWGDTLMVDSPEQSGKMCDWETVQTVNGATQALRTLSANHKVYVATNAADSSEVEIKSVFERVDLAQYISGYFCQSTLGIGKGTPAFFHKIIDQLGVAPHSIIMVGDNYDNDIAPAVRAGIQGIWFNPKHTRVQVAKEVRQIHQLSELCG